MPRQSTAKRVQLFRDERGVSYGIGPDGKRFYVAPSARYDPTTKSVTRGDPGAKQTLLTNKDWNPRTGQYDASTNWGTVAGLATLGAIAAPVGVALATPGAASLAGAGSTSVVPGAGSAGLGGVSTSGLFAPAGGVVGGAGQAASTIAGVTGAGGAGLRAASWLGPLLQYGVPVVGGLVGSTMQANAEQDAARIQADYLTRALAVEQEREQYGRGQRADYLARLRPYGDTGAAAAQRLGVMGSGGPTVRLRAPDGEERDVPASVAEKYLQRGAVRV